MQQAPASQGTHGKADQGPSAGAPGTEKRSGRVAFDARGNPIWEWQLETGVYSRDVSTQKLKKLDLGGLSIAETASYPQPIGLDESSQGKAGQGKPAQSNSNQRKPDQGKPDWDKPGQDKPAPLLGGGFNPYDHSARSNEGSNPYDTARTLGRKSTAPAPAPPQRKPTDLKKLDAWMKLKKRLQNRKDED